MKGLRFLRFLAIGIFAMLPAACSRQSDFQTSPPPFLNSATVTVVPVSTVATSKPEGGRSIQVIGSVNHPGWVVIPADKGLTMVNAVREAGGPNPRASRYVTIRRGLPDGTTKVFANVDLYLAWKGTGPDFPLEDGDVVILPESAFGNSFQ